jgi:hypothetical protein
MKLGWTAARLCAAIALAGGVLLSAQQLPIEPPKQFGTSITGAFEGWFDNPDGSHSLLVGYLNRNRAQELDIPIGPNNLIEPGGPDRGQPTHFLPGRQWGMFVVTVPKEFNAQQRLTWTIVANGQTTSIPLRLHRDYVVSPLVDASGNTPAVVRFEEHGPTMQGPIGTVAKAIARTTSLSGPLPLTLWVTDDMKYTSGTNAPMTRPRPAVTLTWSKFRGPAAVTFDKAKPEVEKLEGGGEAPFSGKATTTAKFAQPGDYILHVTANDYSGGGGGGFQCCWTTAMVKVSVTP